jgi:hypothetical protein
VLLIPLGILKTMTDDQSRFIISTYPLRPCFIGEHTSGLLQVTPAKGVAFIGPNTQKAGHYPQYIVVDFAEVETSTCISTAPFVIWLNNKPFTVLQDLLEELTTSDL